MIGDKIIGVDLRCLPQNGLAGAGVAHASRALCEELALKVKLRFYIPKEVDWQVGDIVRLKDATGGSLRRTLKENPCDLLFVPGGSIAPALNIPAVPWVHDLIIFEHPEWFNQPWWQRLITTYLFKKGLKRAPVIFAVSEYTKSQIVKLLKIDPQKIIVTYEGGDSLINKIKITNYQDSISDKLLINSSKIDNNQILITNNLSISKIKVEAKEFCRQELNLGRGFILCLGTIEPRKNFALIIRAWKRALQKSSQVPNLVMAGVNGWKFDDVEKEIKNLTATESQFFYRYRNVTDEQKRILLLGADMVAVPSLDEGFGLVALEAMQAGTPVAVSNRGALPEVVGEAGMIIDALDEDAWATAFLTCMKDKSACALRSELGLQRAQQFSWKKTAEIVIKLLAINY